MVKQENLPRVRTNNVKHNSSVALVILVGQRSAVWIITIIVHHITHSNYHLQFSKENALETLSFIFLRIQKQTELR